MDINTKIVEINTLYETIKSLEGFLDLLEKSNTTFKHDIKKRNEFCSFEVNSYIWTGDDNPKYSKKITDRETMNCMSEAIKLVIKENIQRYTEKLQELLSNKIYEKSKG